MSGAPRQADKLNTTSLVIVGISASLLVLVSVALLQAFYANDTEGAHTDADYKNQDAVQKSLRMAQLGNLQRCVMAGAGAATHQIPIEHAMALVAATTDHTTFVPAIGAATTMTVPPPSPTGGKPAIVSADAPKQDPVELGKALYLAKACVGCHTLDGNRTVGPSWKGLYGSEVDFADGSKTKVDDAYIKEAILEPAKRIRNGFAPSMPPFAGQLSDDDVNALIAYIKTIK